MFFAYAFGAFVAYALLAPLYCVELGATWRRRPAALTLLALCALKALDWGAYMEADGWLGALPAAIISAFAFYGFQEWVDARIKPGKRDVPLTLSLWKRSAYGLSAVADGWIHLSLFNAFAGRALICFEDETCWVISPAVANALGHVFGVLSTYQFVVLAPGARRTTSAEGCRVLRRSRADKGSKNAQPTFSNFALYFVRSTAAAFLISFFASFIE